MDSDADVESTQQATQNVLDPRRLGKQNSGFTDEDLLDIICILVPYSESAHRALSLMAVHRPQHMVGGEDSAGMELGLAGFNSDTGALGLFPQGQRIALRLSEALSESKVTKNTQGFFTFGRSEECDIYFKNDPHKRMSNIHFRIYLNEHDVLMLADQSTNGTIVDEELLKSKDNRSKARRILKNGSTIRIILHDRSADLVFIVGIPRREDEYEAAYLRKLEAYKRELHQLTQDANATILPGPEGHVNLFPPEFRPRRPDARLPLPYDVTQTNSERFSRAWPGSDKYHKVGEIGKGAFAVVYKVTHKYNGVPYAAKEIEKRKFMKNGILDQKVESEMKIMQMVEHPNIVQYIEHIDWDQRLLIIIMEYIPGGDLGRLILDRGPLTENAVKIMAEQLLAALGYLHEKNITHRDVKPDNILIYSQEPFVVKLTDFGLSKMVDNEETFLRTFCGTLLYCAPEVYSEFVDYNEDGTRTRNPRHRRPSRAHQRYDHAVDIWSLGGVLFYALTKSPPYPVKTGISHSELLHRIMTEKLNITPLLQAGVSAEGIDFLERMLDRRPTTRAAVQDLEDHPWLGGTGSANTTISQSYDEISDDELIEQGASQLSLCDRVRAEHVVPEVVEDDDDEEFNDENAFSGYESDKENYTFGATGQQHPRLFGEVNASAIGSSGVIPEERLNLPVSANSFNTTATTDILGQSEIRDSFDSDASSTPRLKSQKSQPHSGGGLRMSVLSAGQSRSVGQLNDMTFDVESQDLGGTESILENLNMRSLAASHFPSHDSNSFAVSKRKTSYETSEESDGSVLPGRPLIKRFKSDAMLDSLTDYSSDDGENELLAHIPPIARVRSTRQMDEPVDKSTYWTAGDRKSYHLRYPEMTQFQLDAFRQAAVARNEEFGPGKTALWDVAMKYFPPTHYEQVVGRLPLDVERVSNDGNEKIPRRRSENLTDGEAPSTTHGCASEDDDDIPDTWAPQRHIIVPVQAFPPGKRIVASLQSSPDSIVQGISIHITESMLSWGRALENTRVYQPKTERKIPKHAFRIVLWKQGYDPSRDFRPWNKKSDADEDSFHFYIATKASNGIYINGAFLPSHDHQNPSSPSKFWQRLHDGDRIVVWQVEPMVNEKTELTFRCAWGGSSKPREELPAPAAANTKDAPPPPPVAPVPEAVRHKLDELYAKAERRVKIWDEHDFKTEEAEHDKNERAQDIERERERSRLFELRRLEACRILATSRKGSPARVTGPVSAPSPPTGNSNGIGSRMSPCPPAVLVQAARTAPITSVKRAPPTLHDG